MVAHCDDEGEAVLFHIVGVDALEGLAFGVGQRVQTGRGLFGRAFRRQPLGLRKLAGKVDELLLLPDRPFETVTRDGSGNVDDVKAPRLGKSQCLPVDDAASVSIGVVTGPLIGSQKGPLPLVASGQRA